MNKVASYLTQRAAELRQSNPALVAVELLKEAGMSEEDARYEVSQSILEKSAATELSYSGIDMESAARMVKAANINVRELQSFSLITEEDALANTLEKAAAYIEEQAHYIAELEKSAGEVREIIREVEAPIRQAMPEQITKMASVGALTFDDLEALKALPQETLTKMSSAIEQPWEFGKGAGVSADRSDPLLNFLMG